MLLGTIQEKFGGKKSGNDQVSLAPKGRGGGGGGNR